MSSIEQTKTRILADQTNCNYNNNWLQTNQQTWTTNNVQNCFNNNISSNSMDQYRNDSNYYTNNNNRDEDDEPQQQQQNKHLNYQTSVFTTQKLSNSTSKLSYTPYQLELLNSIYKDMKYPNSVQKTLIAKLIGITRDQVKVQ